MASVVSICNLALSNLGKVNINTLSEASAEARACNQFYEVTRDALLAAFDWSFSRKTAVLGQVTNTKPGKWAYAYSVPSDCLVARRVRPQYAAGFNQLSELEEASIPKEIETGTLFCDLSPALLRYTFRNADPSTYPPLFCDALSWQLSVHLAMPLTKDPAQRKDAFQLAQAMQATAAEADASQTVQGYEAPSEFLTVRDDYVTGYVGFAGARV